jgi:hypothetical protein
MKELKDVLQTLSAMYADLSLKEGEVRLPAAESKVTALAILDHTPTVPSVHEPGRFDDWNYALLWALRNVCQKQVEKDSKEALEAEIHNMAALCIIWLLELDKRGPGDEIRSRTDAFLAQRYKK